MCGIVGYVGEKPCEKILVKALKNLEYRGYDSAGIAVFEGDKIKTVKAKGEIDLGLIPRLEKTGGLKAVAGIGHTRWATHGEPSDINAHPIGNARISIVHNGIIENYRKIKEFLISKGYSFESQTDTETVAKLLDYNYNGNPVETIASTVVELEGAYSLGIIFREQKNKIYAVRKESPLVVGIGKDEMYIASDITAILEHTNQYYLPEAGEIAEVDKNGVTFYDIHGNVIEKEIQTAEWDVTAAQKGGYEHFMLKEIYEQPKAVRDTIRPRIKDDKIVIEELGMTDEEIRAVTKIYIVACGSAYHAGVTGKYIFEGLARIPVEVDLASEFRYRNPILEEGALVIVISQSGETADSLAALRLAKDYGVKTLGIVNVVGSSIAREADKVMYTQAGLEIAVATTKAYSCQLVAQYLLAIKFAEARGQIDGDTLTEYLHEMEMLPNQIEILLGNKEKIQKFASRYVAARDVFFIGRGVDYAISLEGSLKLKEISYIHSEAYAAGELKHGTISLIEEGTLVAAVVTQEELYKKIISNIVEVKTRGAYVLAVTNDDNFEIEKTADRVIYIPKTNKYFTNSLAIIPLQLFGYYVSVGKGLDVDKPRNLAKSVTVE